MSMQPNFHSADDDSDAIVRQLADGLTANVYAGDQEIPFQRGDFWRTPGETPHTIRAGSEGCRILDIFAPPRDDSPKPGSGFGSS